MRDCASRRSSPHQQGRSGGDRIGAGTLPQIQVWNKIDATLASPEVQQDACGKITRVLLSARTGEGLELLRQVLTDVALEHKAALAAASESPEPF